MPAKLLGLSSEIGSIEKGKRPGINLIQGVDPDALVLSSKASVKKLV